MGQVFFGGGSGQKSEIGKSFVLPKNGWVTQGGKPSDKLEVGS